MIAYLQQLRLLGRNVRLYLVSTAMVGFAYFGLYSVLFNLYLIRLGYGPEFIGLANAVGFLTNAVFSLPAGALGSRWGSRRTTIAGFVVDVVALILVTLTQLMPVSVRQGWLLATTSLAWLGGALLIVNGMPFLMGAATQQERNTAFAVNMALSPLAGFIGSLVAGVLPGLFASAMTLPEGGASSYGYPLLICAASYVVAVLALLATEEVSASQTKASAIEAAHVPYGLIAMIALYTLLEASGRWGARVFLNVYLDTGLSIPSSLIGGVLAISQLASVPSALAMPYVVRRLGKERTIVLGTLSVACSLLPLALIPHWVVAGLAFLVAMMMARIELTTFMVYYQEVVPDSWRTMASGAVSLATGLGSSLMAFAGGRIIGAAGFRSLFLLEAGLLALASLVFWAYFRVPRVEQAIATGTMRRA